MDDNTRRKGLILSEVRQSEMSKKKNVRMYLGWHLVVNTDAFYWRY